MKRLIIIVLVLFLLFAFFYFIKSNNDNNINNNPVVNQNKAPDFMIKDVLGLKAPLSFFYDKKPVVLAFLSIGCPYCKQEIPVLKKFHEEYKNDVYIIAIFSGQSDVDIKEYAIDNNISFILSSDKNAAILNKYNIISAPSHIIIDKKGNIIKREKGVINFTKLKYLTQKFIN